MMTEIPRGKEVRPVEDKIKDLIRQRRPIEAEAKILRSCYNGNTRKVDSAKAERVNTLDEQIALIDGWLLLLNEDEAYVVKRHLVDGIDWPRIAMEYKGIWGDDYAKSERTLKTYQKRAMEKILRFAREQKSPPDFLQ